MCIVGAGFTGLWTAHALALADPTLRVAVRRTRGGRLRGVGAQRRLVLGAVRHVRRRVGPPARTRRHARDAPGACRRPSTSSAPARGSEGIDCHFAKGGSVDLVRSEAQRVRALAEVDEARALGVGEDDLRWLGPEETRRADRGGRGPRRDLHAALRGAAAGAPGPRAGRRGRAARRPGLRAHRGARHPAGLAGRRPVGRDPRRHRAGGRRGAGHRGLDARPCRGSTATSSRCTRSWWRPSPSATTSGRRRASRAAPPSPTTVT